MLSAIAIENYKSIQKLEIKPGRVNVFIGENGCGKSNILEAIGFAAAAEAKKLDNEFLVSRGIRVTNPILMRSNFDTQFEFEPIEISLSFSTTDIDQDYKLHNENFQYCMWEPALEFGVDFNRFAEVMKNLGVFSGERPMDDETLDLVHKSMDRDKPIKEESFEFYKNEKQKLKSFLILSPENTALRNFYKEGQIEPLGINGEGLLKLLKVIQENTPEKIAIINEALKLFGWYSSVEIPTDINAQEDKIKIQDKYIASSFDQRSANEGFLFVLFYMALMVSEDTPAIFAVDNIDASLNPKMCTKLITIIAELAEKFDKQIFLTTHNPAILDGLDLNDENQKLFVISRNKKGHTRAKEIGVDSLPVSSDKEPIKLSEAMLRGYIGGLPKGF
jgi:predicted ATPase